MAEGRKAFWKKRLTKENMAVMALLGLLLMVIALPVKKEKQTDTQRMSSDAGEAAEPQRQETQEEEYARQMEERLEELLSAMEGVGKVKVMVTLRSSREQVVEKDVPSSMDTMKESDSAGGSRETASSQQQESTVYTTTSAGERQPYVVMTLEPAVEGVTVVAQGGGEGIVQKNITEVIQALFDIEAHKIRVVKMK